MEDLELIGQMAEKKAAALDAFYERYKRTAFTLVYRIVGNREDAEDVLVDVFWQAWQQANRYDSTRGKPLAWLLTIARSRAIDWIRSQANRRTQALDNIPEARSPQTGDPFAR